MKEINSVKNFRKSKVVVAILLIFIAAFSIVYALTQTRHGLAVLTTPPPGIPGPYYVTAEAKIYGPVVDLAVIKSKMGGEYASDYTYVQWGTNPFYRVCVDNTLQEVYYGQMIDVLAMFSENFAIETNLRDTFTDMKNIGAIDVSSVLGLINYFGNIPGIVVAVYRGTGTIRTDCTFWYATEAFAVSWGTSNWNRVTVKLNGSTCVTATASSSGPYDSPPVRGINATGVTGENESLVELNWDISREGTSGSKFGTAIYLKDLNYISYSLGYPNHEIRIYNVVDSPGTGFVSKDVSPSSPVAGATIKVKARLDPPSAEKINITDLYPDTFTWASVDVLLEKFKVGTGLEETAYANVVPAPDGSNMKFTIYYNQAPSILQSLQSDEYIYLTYSLRVPDVAGEYTLPAATMSYLIPTPES